MNFIFDLGNVLVEWKPDKFIAAFEISDDEKFEIEKNLFAHEDWLALDQGTKSQVEVIANVASRSGLSRDKIIYCIEEMKKSLITIEQSVEIMQKLATDGHRIFCLSNMSHDSYAYLKNRDFFKLFEDIVISAEIKMIKPDVEIFEYCLDRFGIKAVETVFIDDSEANIIAAQSVNISCVHFKATAQCYDKIMSFT